MTYSSCDPPKTDLGWKAVLAIVLGACSIFAGFMYVLFMSFAGGPAQIPSVIGNHTTVVHEDLRFIPTVYQLPSPPCIVSAESIWQCQSLVSILL
jgi:hypothetical protein